jgi:WD40 repeat protein
MPHLSAVSHLAFSGDGQRIVTAGWNSLIRLWDAATGLPLSEWQSVGGIPTDLCFDASGQRVAACSGTGLIRVWDFPVAPTPVPAWFPAFAEAIAGHALE